MADQTQTPDQTSENKTSGDKSFLIKERFEIKYDAPLPEFDTNNAKAFKAIDKTNPQRELFVLICDNRFPPRLSMLPYLKSIDHPNILKLVEFGVVNYPAGKSRNMALIYRRPGGPKVTDFLESDADLKTNYERFKSLMLSMVSACESLKGYNLTHRSIRLDNLYYRDNSRSEIVLGDCLATFPALNQPPAYETIESLLCIPQGRGNGTNSDDIYAVGAVMIALLLQKDPAEGMSAPELFNLKLKKSSYSALSGNNKIHNLYITVLKGALADTKENRWTYLQIFNYFEGKANTFGTADILEHSMRALTVNGEKLYTAKSAAIALLRSPREGMELLQSGKLTEWVKNGLENEKLSIKIDKLAHMENAASSNPDQIIGNICVLLDHTLPLRIGSIYAFPNGLPKTIYYYLGDKQNLSDFYNFISGDLIKEWYQAQPQMRAPANSNEFKVFINRRDYGYGIERIMYDFDEDLPCVSPLVENEFVISASQALRALDHNYSKFKDQRPYDHNLIAYLRCKLGKKIDGIITDLNSKSDYLQSSAILRLYANIQNKYGPVQLVNLTQWLLSITRPLVYNYRNLKYRKFLERELPKVAKEGKIIELHELLENEEAKTKDRSEYSEALREAGILNNERSRIVSGGSKLDEEARETALKAASLLAILTMMGSFAFNLIYWIFL